MTKYTFSPGLSFKKEGLWVETPDRTPRFNAVAKKHMDKLPQIELTYFEKKKKRFNEKISPTGIYRIPREAKQFKKNLDYIFSNPKIKKELDDALKEDMKNVTFEELQEDLEANMSPAMKEIDSHFKDLYQSLSNKSI